MTKDGTQIYYKDWGTGQPIVFSHGWPINADAWESQMVFLAFSGYRCVAHDRRGHGRSSQPWNGNDMDTYADDLAELFEVLNLKNAIMIGHSTGGGEVARYIGRHSTSRRVAKVVLIGSVSPLMLHQGLEKYHLTTKVGLYCLLNDMVQWIPVGGEFTVPKYSAIDIYVGADWADNHPTLTLMWDKNWASIFVFRIDVTWEFLGGAAKRGNVPYGTWRSDWLCGA